MKNVFKLVSLLALCVQQSYADLPPKPAYRDYASLTQNSPFGVKKPEVEVTPPAAPVQTTDFALVGVSKTADGWLVTVKDKKDASKRISLRSDGQAVGGLSIVKVDQNQMNYRETKVTVRQGGSTLTLGFDTDEVKKNIAASVKQNEQAAKAAQATAAQMNKPDPATPDEPDNGGNNEYRKARETMMKEAAELRKMRESGNTGEEYQKRRQELMNQANELRREWRSRRRGGDENGRNNPDR